MWKSMNYLKIIIIGLVFILGIARNVFILNWFIDFL